MKFEDAVSDATRAIEIDSNWVKPYIRKAKALQGLRKWKEAREALQAFKGEDTADTEHIRISLRELDECEALSKQL